MNNLNKILRAMAYTILGGILIKLSFVFWNLFGSLDNGSLISRVMGVVFALASLFFVIQSSRPWLKITMVVLDSIIILYYYLYQLMAVPVQLSAVIIALYSGLIIFFVGSWLAKGEQLDVHHLQLAEQLSELATQVSKIKIGIERNNLENEIALVKRRISRNVDPQVKKDNEAVLSELEHQLNKLSHGRL